jgi:hypothetical protein
MRGQLQTASREWQPVPFLTCQVLLFTASVRAEGLIMKMNVNLNFSSGSKSPKNGSHHACPVLWDFWGTRRVCYAMWALDKILAKYWLHNFLSQTSQFTTHFSTRNSLKF